LLNGAATNSQSKRSPSVRCVSRATVALEDVSGHIPHRAVGPNTSFKRRANGKPPGPGRWYSVHFHRPGPGVLPLPPA
jgi:hypothetical protein